MSVGASLSTPSPFFSFYFSSVTDFFLVVPVFAFCARCAKGKTIFMESSSATSHFTIRRSAISETRSNHRCLLPGFVKLRKNFAAERRAVSIKSCMDSSLDGLRIEPYGFRGRDGIVIVDHGSRRKESNLMLNDFVAMFKHKTGYPIVEPAHMELAEPSIKDAFSLCVQHGANRVIVSPFFLFPGRHWHQDIPSLTAEAAKEHSDVSYIITAPLGLHELLVDVVNDRVTHCLSHSTGNVEECDVCAGTGKCRFY